MNAQLLEQLQSSQWKVQEHRIPGHNNVVFCQIMIRRCYLECFYEVGRSAFASFEVVEQRGLLKLGIYRAKVGNAERFKGLLGCSIVKIKEYAAEIEYHVPNALDHWLVFSKSKLAIKILR